MVMQQANFYIGFGRNLITANIFLIFSRITPMRHILRNIELPARSRLPTLESERTLLNEIISNAKF